MFAAHKAGVKIYPIASGDDSAPLLQKKDFGRFKEALSRYIGDETKEGEQGLGQVINEFPENPEFLSKDIHHLVEKVSLVRKVERLFTSGLHSKKL